MFDLTGFPTFLILIVGGIGIAFLARGTWIMWQGDGSAEWLSVEGVVQRVSVRRRMRANFSIGPLAVNRKGGFEVVVEYAYEVGGRVHTSDRWSYAGPLLFTDEKLAERQALQYREATPLTVRYDPTDPSMSVIKPGDANRGLWMCFSGALALFGALYGYLNS